MDYTEEQMDQIESARTMAVLNNALSQPVAAPVSVAPPKNKGGRPKGYSPKTKRIEIPTLQDVAKAATPLPTISTPSVEGTLESDVWLLLFASMLSGLGASASKGVLTAASNNADIGVQEFFKRYK